MPLYIVNRSDGWRTQPHAPAVPAGEVVELPEDIGEDGVDRGYLIPDYPTPYLADEGRAKLTKFHEDRRPESPERKEKPPKKEDPPPFPFAAAEMDPALVIDVEPEPVDVPPRHKNR